MSLPSDGVPCINYSLDPLLAYIQGAILSLGSINHCLSQGITKAFGWNRISSPAFGAGDKTGYGIAIGGVEVTLSLNCKLTPKKMQAALGPVGVMPGTAYAKAAKYVGYCGTNYAICQ